MLTHGTLTAGVWVHPHRSCVGNASAAICASSMEDDLNGAFCATDACGAVLQPACAAAAACPDANKSQSDGTTHGADPFGVSLACAAGVVALDAVPADTACCDDAS